MPIVKDLLGRNLRRWSHVLQLRYVSRVMCSARSADRHRSQPFDGGSHIFPDEQRMKV
jgi:hypothetical protein